MMVVIGVVVMKEVLLFVLRGVVVQEVYYEVRNLNFITKDFLNNFKEYYEWHYNRFPAGPTYSYQDEHGNYHSCDKAGDKFTNIDGCNTCECTGGGDVSCTQFICYKTFLDMHENTMLKTTFNNFISEDSILGKSLINIINFIYEKFWK